MFLAKKKKRAFLSNQVSHLLVISSPQVLVGYKAEPWFHHQRICVTCGSPSREVATRSQSVRVILIPPPYKSSCKNQAVGLVEDNYGVLVLLRERESGYFHSTWLIEIS